MISPVCEVMKVNIYVGNQLYILVNSALIASLSNDINFEITILLPEAY